MPLIITTALTVLFSFSALPGLELGSKMPMQTVKLKSTPDADISMKEAALENGVLEMFSCNTCPYAIKNKARILNIIEVTKAKKIGVILLNSNEAQRRDEDSFPAMSMYAKAQGYKVPYVVDTNSGIADAFGAGRKPECYLFNKDMKLVYHGAIDDNPGDEKSVRKTLGFCTYFTSYKQRNKSERESQRRLWHQAK